MHTVNASRSRARCLLIAVVAAGAGLFSRSAAGSFLPDIVRAYAGDTLWASALYSVFAFLQPRQHSFVLMLMTFIASCAVELSQLCRADWLNAIRATPIGGAALGYGFKSSDLVCYAIGSALGVIADRLLNVCPARVSAG